MYQRPYSAISPKSELFKHSYITNYLFLGGLSLIDLDLLARKMTILVKWTAHPMIESGSATPPILFTNGRNVYPSMSETPRVFLAGRACILKHSELYLY